MGTQNQTKNSQNQEELLKQQQQMQLWQQQQMKNQMLYMSQQWIQTLDKKTVLETLSKYCGSYINCFGNSGVSYQLSSKLLELLSDEETDNVIVNVQQALLYAVNTTNNLKSFMMYSGIGANNMQFNQFGMNPMMGGQFGMPGMNPMMGGQFGMPVNTPNPSEMTEEEKETNKIQIAKQYIRQYIYQADPLIFLQILYNQGKISLNLDNDKNLEFLIAQALASSLYAMANTNNSVFNTAYTTLYQLYMSDYYSKLNKNSNGNSQQNQFGMNPMMGGQFGMPGMNPMMGGQFGMPGMNPMMGGQFGMPGMMSGMDQYNMGGLGVGPMMNAGVNMMGGMTGGVGMNMPGMNGSSVSNCMF